MDQFSIDVQHRENRLWQRKLAFYKEEMKFFKELLFQSEMSSDIIKIMKKRVAAWSKKLNVSLDRVLRSEKRLTTAAQAEKLETRDHEELRYDISKLDMEYHVQIREFQAVLLGLAGS